MQTSIGAGTQAFQVPPAECRATEESTLHNINLDEPGSRRKGRGWRDADRWSATARETDRDRITVRGTMPETFSRPPCRTATQSGSLPGGANRDVVVASPGALRAPNLVGRSARRQTVPHMADLLVDREIHRLAQEMHAAVGKRDVNAGRVQADCTVPYAAGIMG